MRALRPDKLTIAGLATTLALYRDGRASEVPTVAMLAASAAELRARADALATAIGSVDGLVIAVEACESAVGGGAMPTARLPSFAVTLAGRPEDDIDRLLREAPVPVIARIEDGRVWLDLRTIAIADIDDVIVAARRL
jgi:L-seryl-tRNA(Ser) seleniumtransferase